MKIKIFLNTFILTSLLTILSQFESNAQVPCGVATDEPPGCGLCYPVYAGSTAGYTPGTSISSFCGTIENNQWLSFQASETSATISILSYNCVNDDGVQLLISDTNLNPVSTCIVTYLNNFPFNVTATGLTPGDAYYIMIDGYRGDICDFIINIVNGVHQDPPGLVDKIIAKPNQSTYNPEDIVCYEVTPDPFASYYDWTLPIGATIVYQNTNQSRICVRYDEPVIGSICVTVSNPCGVNAPICKNVNVGTYQPCLGFSELCRSVTDSSIDVEITSPHDLIPSDPNNNYGCYSTPLNSRYFIFETGDQDGNLDIEISNYGSSDINSVVWGPFDSLYQVHNACGSLDTPYYCDNSDTIALQNLIHEKYYLLMLDFKTDTFYPTFDAKILSGFNTLDKCYVDYYHDILPCGYSSHLMPGCLVCDSIYNGETSYTSSIPQPSGFCGSFDNPRWISFVAGQENMEVFITPGVCTYYRGLEMMLFDLDGKGVSNCYSSYANNMPGKIVANNLMPGDTYALVVDGFNGAKCEYELSITGMANLQPINNNTISSYPSGIQQSCIGEEICFSIEDGSLYSNSIWEFPEGAVITRQNNKRNEVCVRFFSTGMDSVCVTQRNACYTGDRICIPFEITNGISVDIPPISACLNDFPLMIDGHQFQSPGFYSFSNSTANACDSTTNYEILSLSSLFDSLTTDLCPGDSIFLYNQYFHSTGNYNVFIPGTDTLHCDSLITIQVEDASPLIRLSNNYLILDCIPGSQLLLDASPSDTNSSFFWKVENGGNIISGQNTAQITIDHAGTYILELTDLQTNCTSIDTFEVTNPPLQYDTPVFNQLPLDVCLGDINTYSIDSVPFATNYQWTLPGNASLIQDIGTSIEVIWNDANGGTICVQALGNCGSSMDTCISVSVFQLPTVSISGDQQTCGTAAISISTSGNTSNTHHYWNTDGAVNANISGPGPHSLSWNTPGVKNISLIIEENGCISDSILHSVIVNEIPVLTANVQSPVWWPGSLGKITTQVSGGTPTYSYQWSNGFNGPDPSNLSEGLYCLSLTDAAGCTTTDCYNVGGGIYRINSVHVICLGDSKRLSIRPSRGADFSWYPSKGLSCDDCSNPIISPDRTTAYTITATLLDGTIASTNIWAIVLPPIFCNNLPKDLDASVLENISFEAAKDIIEKEFFVYPNPVFDLVNIYSMANMEAIEVFSMDGKLLKRIENIFDVNYELNFESLQSGTVFLKIRTESGVNVKKLVIQK